MKKQFDYIIIGAGSAGCVLANRLSANPKNDVLLIEAGKKDNDFKIHAPALFSKLFKTKYDYDYESVVSKTMNNRSFYLPRGKVLGGSSSINAMIYIRGHKQDFEDWATLGNKGWSYDEVLPYFKKSEHNEDFQNTFHGTGGELNVYQRNYTHPLSHRFIEAGESLGYPKNKDFNGVSQTGFGLYQVTQKNGTRWSTATAFLKPIMHRKNLTVLTRATTEKINIKNKIATGVTLHHKGSKISIKASKEVLLSAGTYESPKIMMLSGIGCEKELKKHEIEVQQELKGVGKNLQDHCALSNVIDTHDKSTIDAAERFPAVLGHLFNYITSKKGPLSSNIGEAGAFIKSNAKLKAPDIQFHFGPAYFMNHGFDNPKKGNGISIGSKVVRPKSIGSVTLKSNNYRDKPLIDHNYFSNDNDLEKACWGFKVSQQVFETSLFKPLLKNYRLPSKVLNNENEIIDLIKQNAYTLYHPTSTCKMGTDNKAVVNEKLKVHGIEKLRIVDASIMPTITSGNTNAPVIMIAEKAAELILKENK